MSKRSRIVLLSCITVLCCVALIVAGTFALFTYNRTVTNHLRAGSLTATLTRTKLTSTALSANGKLETVTDTQTKDFTAQNTENVFGLTSREAIAPGCYFEAAMRLANRGTIGFVYWIEIKGIEGDKELQDELELTLTAPDGQIKSAILSSDDAAQIMGSESEPIATLLVGESDDFTVTLKFLSEAGNSAQTKQASFDLIVHAQQLTV